MRDRSQRSSRTKRKSRCEACGVRHGGPRGRQQRRLAEEVRVVDVGPRGDEQLGDLLAVGLGKTPTRTPGALSRRAPESEESDFRDLGWGDSKQGNPNLSENTKLPAKRARTARGPSVGTRTLRMELVETWGAPEGVGFGPRSSGPPEAAAQRCSRVLPSRSKAPTTSSTAAPPKAPHMPVLTSQAATCQAPLQQRLTDNAAAFRIPFGGHACDRRRAPLRSHPHLCALSIPRPGLRSALAPRFWKWGSPGIDSSFRRTKVVPRQGS